MTTLPLSAEPLYVSDRFRLTVRATILALQAGAALDETTLPLLQDADHRRRHRLLIQRQLDRAFRLQDLLDQTVPHAVALPESQTQRAA